MCPSCEMCKTKRSTFKTKTFPSSEGWLQLLHMDLCGPMRVESINGKKYNLVIVDDYSRYTWTHFLRSKDETPEVLVDFLKMIQRGLQAQVITVRTDRGTKFLNKTLHAYFKEEGIEHQTSIARTPEQNGVVERRNRTLVEATRTIVLASKLLFPMYEEYFTAGTQIQEVAEPSSRNIDTLNMHAFYQLHRSDYQWTKNHPLEQVHRNPSMPVQTRRQLATDPEMCMFALTVSTAKLKNIKEAMADHA
ncbi:retrovirus-related pol polyprotein from transposon TNT 1-94 [Tanacetum coccineum]